jgi:protein involved in polysaccharide export with SLBB domain
MAKDQSMRPIAAFSPTGPGVGRIMVYAAAIMLLGGSPAFTQRSPNAPTVPASRPTEEYRLGPGDQLAITFPYNAELNYEGTVGPDGRLTVPLIDPLPLAGRTVTEASSMVSEALRRGGIVADARPSVAVRTYGASVYVGGEVRTPGAVRLSGPMDVMRAVIMAGGVLETAHSKQVVVIRRLPDGTPSLHYVDLRAYVKRGGAGQTEMLRPEDVVFVPRSSVAEANLWIDQYINRMLPFSRSLNYNVGNSGAGTILSR